MISLDHQPDTQLSHIHCGNELSTTSWEVFINLSFSNEEIPRCPFCDIPIVSSDELVSIKKGC